MISSTSDPVGKHVEYLVCSSTETRSFAAEIYAKVPRKGRVISDCQKQQREVAKLVQKQITYKLLANHEEDDREVAKLVQKQSTYKLLADQEEDDVHKHTSNSASASSKSREPFRGEYRRPR